MKTLLVPPLTAVWKTRVFAYNQGFLKSVKVDSKIFSIGNLTFGGTGKTPFTEHVLGFLEKNRIKCAVVSRGYGGTYDHVQEVDLNLKDPAQIFGDEIVWLKRQHPDIPMAVAKKRSLGCELMVDRYKPQVILTDDGFQHWALQRDLDIVLIDASEPAESLYLFPRGRGREPLEALKRAKVIVFTKRNWADESEFKKVKDLVKLHTIDGVLVCELNFAITQFRDARLLPPNERVNSTSQAEKTTELSVSSSVSISGRKIALLSGIARPQLFEKMVKDNGAMVANHFVFKDHHAYTKDEVEKIHLWCRANAVSTICTTAKDWERLRPFNFDIEVLVADLELRPGKNFEKFYDFLLNWAR